MLLFLYLNSLFNDTDALGINDDATVLVVLGKRLNGVTL